MRTLRPCGTDAAYQRHLKEGAPVTCGPCIAAHNTACIKWSQDFRDRRTRGEPLRALNPCGTYGAYQRHLKNGEHCDVCVAAVTVIARERRLPRKYNLSIAEYHAMLERQEGRCAICRTDVPPRGWCIDHDHACCPGKVSCGRCIRGLLCGRCNHGLGHFKDSPALMTAAIAYLSISRQENDRRNEFL